MLLVHDEFIVLGSKQRLYTIPEIATTSACVEDNRDSPCACLCFPISSTSASDGASTWRIFSEEKEEEEDNDKSDDEDDGDDEEEDKITIAAGKFSKREVDAEIDTDDNGCDVSFFSPRLSSGAAESKRQNPSNDRRLTGS